MIDWNAVKQDYIDGMSYGQLATKYGKSKTSIYNRGNAEGWGNLREIKLNDEHKVNASIIVQPPRDGTTEEMLEVVIGLTRVLKDAVADGCDPTAVQGYALSIKSLQQTYSNLVGTQYMLDLEKIESLKRQYQVVNDDAETGVIVLPEVEVDG